jgi:outer membrane protein OmpA-like peptidoglycan-associated protein
LNFPGKYAFNATRNLYYVYVHDTYDKEYAKTLAYNLRFKSDFKAAWIYNGPLLSETISGPLAKAVLKKNMQESFVSTVAITNAPVVNTASNAVESITLENRTVVSPGSQATVEEREVAKPLGKPFIFKLVNAATKTPINGNIKLIESEKYNQYEKYKANELVYIPSPKNNSGKLVIECNMVGYKVFKKAVNYENLLKELENGSGGNQEIVIPIELTRLKKGTYLDLEGISFHEHSDILTPESEAKLMELVYLMENPKYKIRLHGHVHDENSKEIITRGHSNNFFSLEQAKHRMHNTAKKLSHHRANTIKAYLVSKGVHANRIKTKGYGASLAIFEHAHANDRIEMEIVR